MNKNRALTCLVATCISFASAAPGYDRHDDVIHIIPRAIQSPIYNLPLQESLWSLECVEQCGSWGIACAPYVKVPSQRTNFGLRETEAGALIASRLGWSFLWLDSLMSFGYNEVTFDDRRHDSDFSSCRWGIFDVLLGIGTSYTSPCLDIAFKGLMGVASPERYKDSSWLVNMPHISVGAQASARYILSETACSQGLIVACARYLYFLKNSLHLVKHGEEVTESSQKMCSVRPGSFIDLMLGYKHRWGDDFHHQVELGYNPTINVGASIRPAAFVYEDHPFPFNEGNGKINMTRQAIYAAYAYEYMWRNYLMKWGLGTSINVQRIAGIDESPATIWASWSILY